MANSRENIPPDIVMRDYDPSANSPYTQQALNPVVSIQNRPLPHLPPQPPHFPHKILRTDAPVSLSSSLSAARHPVPGLSRATAVPINGLPTVPLFPITNRDFLLDWANEYCQVPPSYVALISTPTPWQWPGAVPNSSTTVAQPPLRRLQNSRPVDAISHQGNATGFINYYGPDDPTYGATNPVSRDPPLQRSEWYHIPAFQPRTGGSGQHLQAFNAGASLGGPVTGLPTIHTFQPGVLPGNTTATRNDGLLDSNSLGWPAPSNMAYMSGWVPVTGGISHPLPRQPNNLPQHISVSEPVTTRDIRHPPSRQLRNLQPKKPPQYALSQTIITGDVLHPPSRQSKHSQEYFFVNEPVTTGEIPHLPSRQLQKPREYVFVSEPIPTGSQATASETQKQSSTFHKPSVDAFPVFQPQERTQSVETTASNTAEPEASVPDHSSYFLTHQEPLDAASRMKQKVYHEKGVAWREHRAAKEREKIIAQNEKQLLERTPRTRASTSATRNDQPALGQAIQGPIQSAHGPRSRKKQPRPQTQPEMVSQTPLDPRISSVYEEYKLPVIVYSINTERATMFNSAYDWVEVIPGFLKEYDQVTTYKTFKHITHGYIKDGDYLSVVVLQNASDPFPPSSYGPYPRTTTSLGVYKDSETKITWTTIAPQISSLLFYCIGMDVLKEVGRWDYPPPPAQLRFHKAYWLLANLKPLGGLLNDATRRFSPTTWDEEDEKKDGDDNQIGDELMEGDGVVPDDTEMIDDDDMEGAPEEWEPTNSGWEASEEQAHAAFLQLQHPECRIIGFSD